MPQGRIIRSISGFYDVDNGQEVLRCRAKGSFRKKNITPLVGDQVEYSKEGWVEELLPRRNRLIRPQVANVDQAVIVFAAAYPEPNWLLMERFLVMVAQQKIQPLICINKWDQIQDRKETQDAAVSYEKAGFRVIRTCTRTQEGAEELRQALSGRLSVFAGPSGVGKSSLLNLLGLTQETGDLSEKIQRGKNTTRCAELMRLPEGDGYVVDTPGFTSLRLSEIQPEELENLYPDFAPYLKHCYYQGCSHVAEEDCGVREAFLAGKIERIRYEGYCAIWKELKEMQESVR